MPRPTKLLPGQEVTVEAFNAEIDRTRKQLSGAVGSTMQTGTTGGGLTPMRELQPLWGRLTGTGPVSPVRDEAVTDRHPPEQLNRGIPLRLRELR